MFQTAVKRVEIALDTHHALRHTEITEGVHASDANVVDISHIADPKDLRTTGHRSDSWRYFCGCFRSDYDRRAE